MLRRVPISAASSQLARAASSFSVSSPAFSRLARPSLFSPMRPLPSTTLAARLMSASASKDGHHAHGHGHEKHENVIDTTATPVPSPSVPTPLADTVPPASTASVSPEEATAPAAAAAAAAAADAASESASASSAASDSETDVQALIDELPELIEIMRMKETGKKSFGISNLVIHRLFNRLAVGISSFGSIIAMFGGPAIEIPSRLIWISLLGSFLGPTLMSEIVTRVQLCPRTRELVFTLYPHSIRDSLLSEVAPLTPRTLRVPVAAIISFADAANYRLRFSRWLTDGACVIVPPYAKFMTEEVLEAVNSGSVPEVQSYSLHARLRLRRVLKEFAAIPNPDPAQLKEFVDSAEGKEVQELAEAAYRTYMASTPMLQRALDTMLGKTMLYFPADADIVNEEAFERLLGLTTADVRGKYAAALEERERRLLKKEKERQERE